MILTLIIAIASLVILMIVHEFGHFIIAKKFGVRVDEFGIGYPPKLFGKKFGETEYSINLIPFGAFVRIYGEEGGVDDYRSFSNLAIWKRILICLGGVLAFWIAAAIIFSFAFMIGADVPIGDQNVAGISNTRIQVEAVQKNSPADLAGIHPKDIVVGFDTITDFQKFTKENAGKETSVLIRRKDQMFTVRLTPRVRILDGEGPTGVSLERMAQVIKKVPFYQAPFYGVTYTGQVTWEALRGIVAFFASLFRGHGLPQGAQLAVPVGITIFLSRAVEYGLGFFLYFIGSLTVLLAIFNLFPIPALDGGKLIFLIIEKFYKKPVPVVWEQGLTVFFFFLLITMSLFVTVKFDIPRVMDFWKSGN